MVKDSNRNRETMKPSNDEEMLEVNGVGEHKLQKYGERFLNEIQKYK